MCTRGICTARLYIYIIIIFLYTRVYLTRVGETRLIRLDVMYTGRSTGSCLTVVSVDAYNIIRFRKTRSLRSYNVYKVTYMRYIIAVVYN